MKPEDVGRPKFKVVLDTNVYVSALNFPESGLYKIWAEAVERSYRLFFSLEIARELARVLRERFGWGEKRIIRHLKLMTRVGEIVTPLEELNEIQEDPSDNRILECAVEGDVDLIVSGDDDLLRLKEFHGISIVRPGLVEILRQGDIGWQRNGAA